LSRPMVGGTAKARRRWNGFYCLGLGSGSCPHSGGRDDIEEVYAGVVDMEAGHRRGPVGLPVIDMHVVSGAQDRLDGEGPGQPPASPGSTATALGGGDGPASA
jgi:hypothetical protein